MINTSCLYTLAMPNKKYYSAHLHRLVMVIGAADSTLQVVDVERGELLGKPLRPKTPSTECLCLAALDLEALRTGPVHRQAVLSWSVPETVAEEAGQPALELARDPSETMPTALGAGGRQESGLEAGRTLSFDQGALSLLVCVLTCTHAVVFSTNRSPQRRQT